MDVPAALLPFWNRCLSGLGADAPSRFYEAFHFGDREADAALLARLVLAGEKRATAALAWAFEADGKRLPRAGDLSVVTDWNGKPLCVIETLSLEVVPFEEVTAAFAAEEGEGERSLAAWREVHWAYFARECARIGRAPDTRMPVACERFAVACTPEGGFPG